VDNNNAKFSANAKKLNPTENLTATYSFGSLAYEFYYSGEIIKEFPYATN
jgi:hypothetical protein